MLNFPFAHLVRSPAARGAFKGRSSLDGHLQTQSPIPPSSCHLLDPHRSLHHQTTSNPHGRGISSNVVRPRPSSHDRWGLMERSFKLSPRRPFQTTDTGDICVLDKPCTMNEVTIAQCEEDMVEVHDRSLDIIATIVRLLPFALTTHLIWSLTRRFCISSPVLSSPFRSSD